MKYYLQVLPIGQDTRIGITEKEFHELRQAKDVITSFFSLTENYRVVVESYRAVEKAKHDAELDHILYFRFGYDDFSDVRVALNSPIVGYLASTRYFLDSTDKILLKILSPAQMESFNKFRSNIYDSTSEFRFIEALRNYVQHRELPVHTVTYHNYVEDKDNIETSDKVSSLSLRATRQTLQEDKKFKKAALERMPAVIDIIYCIRFHMEGIWKLYDYLARFHFGEADNARATILSAIERFEANGGNSLGLHAIAQQTENVVTEKVPLLLNWDDVRRAALKKIGNLNNLHKRYVTGKIQKA